MGLYDEITCEYPLPDTAERGQRFQTKSLDPAMVHYTITDDGRLILHEFRYEDVPEEERPYYGKPEWAHPFMQLAGSIRAIPVADVDVDFHGDLVMYRDDRTYKVRFTEGRVQWIRGIEAD